MKAIKRRRATVKNIQQITKAMNLVATSKLQKAKNTLYAIEKPLEATFKIAFTTFNNEAAANQLYIERRDEVKKVAYILITSHRGLCGGYNSAVCKELAKHSNELGKDFVIVPIGTKGRDYFRRRNGKLVDFDNREFNAFETAHNAAYLIMEMYEKGEIDEVYVVYTKFISVLNQVPVVKPLLPIDVDFVRCALNIDFIGDDKEQWKASEFDLGFFHEVPRPGVSSNQPVDYEPNLETVLGEVVPWYLSMFLQAAINSAALCEEASRMTSMDSATNNAGDIIDKLTLIYNRQRQSIITQEITEIVSGANALQ